MAVALSNIINIFATPTDVFENIKKTPKWPVAFLIICAVSLICGYFMLPFIQKIMEETFTVKMSEEQAQKVASTTSRYRMFMRLLIPITFLLKWLFISSFLYLGAILFDAQKNNFKTLYAVVVYSEFILALMGIINVLLILIKGVDAVSNLTDLHTIIGLDFFLADKSQNVLLFNFLNNFNVFSVWYVVVLTIGMSVICQLKKWKSAVLVTSVWFWGVGFQFAVGLLSENMQLMMGR
ncbi:MAG: YIP1 family protein [Bacteroidetes bacterium]|nr:YIP1 family protein [Bacteroidota bacterium]